MQDTKLAKVIEQTVAKKGVIRKKTSITNSTDLPQWLLSDDSEDDDDFYGFPLEMIERESCYFNIDYSLDTRWYDLYGDDSDLDEIDTFEGFPISDV